MAPYAVHGLAVLVGAVLCSRGGVTCGLKVGETNVDAGVAELDEYELLGPGAAVGVVVVRPEEDPADPP